MQQCFRLERMIMRFSFLFLCLLSVIPVSAEPISNPVVLNIFAGREEKISKIFLQGSREFGTQ